MNTFYTFFWQEMRICAYLSRDKHLAKIFSNATNGNGNRGGNCDIYRVMASQLFGVELVTDIMRSQAKTLTLAILYGMVLLIEALSLYTSFL